MSRIFISYSSKDRPHAEAISEWLSENGWADHFVDYDPIRGIRAAQRWKDALRTAQGRCEAVLFLISEAWLESEWCKREWDWADAMGRRLIPVLIKAVEDRPAWLESEWQIGSLVAAGNGDSERQMSRSIAYSENGLKWLWQGLSDCGLGPSSFRFSVSRKPFRGMDSLEGEDAAIFFGRDSKLGEALDTLRRMREPGSSKVFAVLGASGAGKSSFLKAGLIPRLQRDRSFLPLTAIRPGRGLLSSEQGLAAAIIRALNPSTKSTLDVLALLRRGQEGIESVVAMLRSKAREAFIGVVSPTIVISIDQAEELLSAEEPAALEAAEFFNLLPNLLTLENDVIVILTIRSDLFVGLQTDARFLNYPLELFNLPPLPSSSLKEIIEKPIEVYVANGGRLSMDPALIDALAEDSVGADALPLLAFTLERLFSLRNGGQLSIGDYSAMDRTRGVIEAAVREALGRFHRRAGAEAGDELVRKAFVPALATWDSKADVAKRREAKESEIPAEARQLLNCFVDLRLVVRRGEGGAVIYEVAHEALLRQWDKLRRWVESERDALLARDFLKSAAADWWTAPESSKASRLIHSEARLTQAETWLLEEDGYGTQFSEIDRAYIAACRVHENRTRRTYALLNLTSAKLALAEADDQRALRYALNGLLQAKDFDGAIAPELVDIVESVVAMPTISSRIPCPIQISVVCFASRTSRIAYGARMQTDIWIYDCRATADPLFVRLGGGLVGLRFSDSGRFLCVIHTRGIDILDCDHLGAPVSSRSADTQDVASRPMTGLQVCDDGKHGFVATDEHIIFLNESDEKIISSNQKDWEARDEQDQSLVDLIFSNDGQRLFIARSKSVSEWERGPDGLALKEIRRAPFMETVEELSTGGGELFAQLRVGTGTRVVYRAFDTWPKLVQHIQSTPRARASSKTADYERMKRAGTLDLDEELEGWRNPSREILVWDLKRRPRMEGLESITLASEDERSTLTLKDNFLEVAWAQKAETLRAPQGKFLSAEFVRGAGGWVAERHEKGEIFYRTTDPSQTFEFDYSIFEQGYPRLDPVYSKRLIVGDGQFLVVVCVGQGSRSCTIRRFATGEIVWRAPADPVTFDLDPIYNDELKILAVPHSYGIHLVQLGIANPLESSEHYDHNFDAICFTEKNEIVLAEDWKLSIEPLKGRGASKVSFDAVASSWRTFNKKISGPRRIPQDRTHILWKGKGVVQVTTGGRLILASENSWVHQVELATSHKPYWIGARGSIAWIQKEGGLKVLESPAKGVRPFQNRALPSAIVAWSADEMWLATASGEGRLHVWYVPVGQVSLELDVKEFKLQDFEFDLTGARFLALDVEGRCLAWNLVLPAVGQASLARALASRGGAGIWDKADRDDPVVATAPADVFESIVSLAPASLRTLLQEERERISSSWKTSSQSAMQPASAGQHRTAAISFAYDKFRSFLALAESGVSSWLSDTIFRPFKHLGRSVTTWLAVLAITLFIGAVVIAFGMLSLVLAGEDLPFLPAQ